MGWVERAAESERDECVAFALLLVRYLEPKTLARERIRKLREDLSTRRRTLAVAASLPSNTPTNPSPPAPTLPGSFPGQPFSPPPPSTRSHASHRRLSSASSSQTPSPSRPPSVSRTPQTLPQLATRVSHAARALGSPSTPSSHSPSPFQRQSPAALGAANGTDRDMAPQIEEATYQLTALSDTIARARSGLVQELVEVFSVVEVGGRPPLGGKAGTKGEWTIGGLVLPVPGDMRRASHSRLSHGLSTNRLAGYPPDHINAVITHTLHFLSLLAFYLGIKLPFEVVWSRSSTPPTGSQATASAAPNLRGNGLLGVGTPWIGATKGSEHGGWAR